MTITGKQIFLLNLPAIQTRKQLDRTVIVIYEKMNEEVVIVIDETLKAQEKIDFRNDESVDVWEDEEKAISSDRALLQEAESPSRFPTFLKNLISAFLFGLILMVPAFIIRGSLGDVNATSWFSARIEGSVSSAVYLWSLLLACGWVAGCVVLSLISFMFALCGYLVSLPGGSLVGRRGLVLLGILAKIRIGISIITATMITFDIARSSGVTPYGIYRLYASAVVLGFLLILKALVMWQIEKQYFSKYLGKRMVGNARALKLLGKLWDYYLSDFEVSTKYRGRNRHENTHITSDQAVDIGGRLYQAISREAQSEVILPKHFTSVLKEKDALFFLDYVDVDQNGDLTREDFESGVKLIYEERKTVHTCYIDSDRMLADLDTLGTLFCLALNIMMTIGLFGLSVTNQILLQANFLVVIKFFFEDVFARGFQCLIFVFIQHTFDVGDFVFVNGAVFKVKQIGLWSTTLVDLENKLSYISNLSLSDSRVCNFNRSPPQALEFTVALHSSTTRGQLAKMEQKINEFIQANPRDFTLDDCYVKNIALINSEAITFQLQYTHRSNFIARSVMFKRHRMIMEQFQKVVRELGMKMAPYSLDLPRVALTPH